MPSETPPPPGPSLIDTSSLARQYEAIERELVQSGLLRTDAGGGAGPLAPAVLARNFERIAFFEEYTLRNGQFDFEQSEIRLRRWQEPIVFEPLFGQSFSIERSNAERAILGTYVARLSEVTGHPMRVARQAGNFHVLFMDANELSQAAPILRRLVPGISNATINQITNLDPSSFCFVAAFTEPGSSVYTNAIAIIRAEHPELLRRSCVHEEIAQGLGLPNDSPEAEPSIFNDDNAYALLTSHDELLLEMLYDERLRPGMTRDEALPLLLQLAQDAIGTTAQASASGVE